MSVEITRRATAALLLAGLASPALAQTPSVGTGKRDADRRAILAMAGDFRVRFDFRETVAFVDDYKPIAPHVTGGTEIVRAIEDAGDVIRLQHILVMDDTSGPIIIKHWRQDWTYEPRTELQYKGPSAWAVTSVDARTRKGAWSQTVWQTDDSPRYGGVGVWEHADGASSWTSAPTLRPLARRDAVRKPPYDRYRGVNRHALTPTGWAHEQDNAKIGIRNGVSTTFVHETVINTYTRNTAFPIPAGDAYWSKTQEYWRAVRTEWDRVISTERGVRVTEEAENGSTTGPTLMDLADQIAAGTLKTTAAIAQAKNAIRDKR
jgi:hypothetical protein